MILEIINQRIKNNQAITIQAKTNSNITAITSYDKELDIFKMHVNAIPENGKANETILKHLKKLTKHEAEIIFGKTSKRKLIKFK